MYLHSYSPQRGAGSRAASPTPLGARAGKAAVATVLLLSVWIALLSVSPASAQSLDRYRTFLGPYDYTATGNTLRDSESPSNSVKASSSADVTIPTGATVSAAYLYWAGSYADTVNTTVPVDSIVTFDGQSRTADRTFTSTFTFNSVDYDFFSGFEDVTSQIQAKGTGTHTLTFTDLTVNTGVPHSNAGAVLAGWAVFVVYQDPSDTQTRKINIYDGFLTSRNAQEQVTLRYISVPSNPNGRFSYLVWEGDKGNSRAVTGGTITEKIEFNGNLLFDDNLNPAPTDSTGPFNSTNTFINSDTTHGLDLDEFNVEDFLTAGDQSATATLSAGGTSSSPT